MAALSISLCSSILFASVDGGPVTTQSFSGLRLDLKTDSPPLVLGVPVTAELTLTNVADHPLSLYWPKTYDDLELEVAREGEPFEKVSWREGGPEIRTKVVSFDPGRSEVLDPVYLWFRGRRTMRDERRFLFPEPGVYRIRVTAVQCMKTDGRTTMALIPSNEVEVRVLPAEPGFEAFKELVSRVAHDDLLFSMKGWADIEGYVARGEAGRYSGIVKFVVLNYWAEGREQKELLQEVRSSDRLERMARDVLRDLGTSRRPMNGVANYVLAVSTLARAYKASAADRGDVLRQAEGYLAELQKVAPKSLLLRNANDLSMHLKEGEEK